MNTWGFKNQSRFDSNVFLKVIQEQRLNLCTKQEKKMNAMLTLTMKMKLITLKTKGEGNVNSNDSDVNDSSA